MIVKCFEVLLNSKVLSLSCVRIDLVMKQFNVVHRLLHSLEILVRLVLPLISYAENNTGRIRGWKYREEDAAVMSCRCLCKCRLSGGKPLRNYVFE